MANAHDRTRKHGHAVAVGWITPPYVPILRQARLLASSAGSCRCAGDKNPWSHMGVLHTHRDSLGRGLFWRQQWMLTWTWSGDLGAGLLSSFAVPMSPLHPLPPKLQFFRSVANHHKPIWIPVLSCLVDLTIS